MHENDIIRRRALRITLYRKIKNSNPEILKLLSQCLYREMLPKCMQQEYYPTITSATQKEAAQQLIQLLSIDKLSAEIFWDSLANYCKKPHEDHHYDGYFVGHNDCNPSPSGYTNTHDDRGANITFPPYPFND